MSYKRILILLILITPTLDYKKESRKIAGEVNFDKALRETTKALMRVKVVKGYTKTLEKKALSKISQYSGLDKDEIAAAIPVITTIATGKISTEGVNINWNITESASLKPQIEYNFRDNTFNSSFQLEWGF